MKLVKDRHQNISLESDFEDILHKGPDQHSIEL